MTLGRKVNRYEQMGQKKQPRKTICVRLKRSSPHHGIRNPPVPPRLPRSKPYSDLSALRPRLNSLHLIWTRDHQNFVLHMCNILRSCPWNIRNQSPSWSISRKRQYRDQKQKSGLFQSFPVLKVLLRAALQSDWSESSAQAKFLLCESGSEYNNYCNLYCKRNNGSL